MECAFFCAVSVLAAWGTGRARDGVQLGFAWLVLSGAGVALGSFFFFGGRKLPEGYISLGGLALVAASVLSGLFALVAIGIARRRRRQELPDAERPDHIGR